jgi:hypothetical protein
VKRKRSERKRRSEEESLRAHSQSLWVAVIRREKCQPRLGGKIARHQRELCVRELAAYHLGVGGTSVCVCVRVCVMGWV